jgi:hypothetical protein
MKRTTAQRVIEAAENYVQFLDEDSVADQQADFRLKLERDRAEGELIAAVREHCRAVTGESEMKIDRLAGLPGEPTAEVAFGDYWMVLQIVDEEGQLFGPTHKDKRSAIRAWNAMVRRIRKANAQGLEGTK